MMEWTDAHIEELRRLYPVTDVDELAERFGVSANAVRHVAHRFGIRRRDLPSSRDTWTAERIRFLRENVATMTYDELAEHLGVTPTTVRVKATQLGVQRPHGWTDERVARLRAEVAEVDPWEIAEHLGLTEGTVRAKANELGLAMRRRLYWTDERIDEFLEAYETTPKEELAERYGLAVKSVSETASRFKRTRRQARPA